MGRHLVFALIRREGFSRKLSLLQTLSLREVFGGSFSKPAEGWSAAAEYYPINSPSLDDSLYWEFNRSQKEAERVLGELDSNATFATKQRKYQNLDLDHSLVISIGQPELIRLIIDPILQGIFGEPGEDILVYFEYPGSDSKGPEPSTWLARLMLAAVFEKLRPRFAWSIDSVTVNEGLAGGWGKHLPEPWRFPDPWRSRPHLMVFGEELVRKHRIDAALAALEQDLFRVWSLDGSILWIEDPIGFGNERSEFVRVALSHGSEEFSLRFINPELSKIIRNKGKTHQEAQELLLRQLFGQEIWGF